MFSFFRRKKNFFSPEEQQQIVQAVTHAEQRTSGEVRVFVESRCSYMDAMDRAVEIFYNMGMQKTKQRNAVLVYVAMQDRQLAIFGDEGIHQKLGDKYWKDEVEKMIGHFSCNNFSQAIIQCVQDIGEALHFHFPYNNQTDKNELPDNIVFGK